MFVVQRLGSGPWSTDEFHSHKAHKQLAMVLMAAKDMGVLLPRGGLILGLLSVIPLHRPKASLRPSVEDGTLVLQWTQLYSLRGFQSFCGIYVALLSLLPHLVGFDLDWEAIQHRPPVPLLLWCKSNMKVGLLVTLVKSQTHVSLFGLLPSTVAGPGFTRWWIAP